MPEELTRIHYQADKMPNPILAACPVCGSRYPLWFNGGELDAVRCCGHKLELRHITVALVVTKM